MTQFVLKIATRDEKGLIYKISKLIFARGLNIVKNDEFVGEGQFFFRAILDGEAILGGGFDAFVSELQGELKGANIELCEIRKKDIVIFATKEAHCLGDLLIKHYSNELCANIKAVISNHNELAELVGKFDIPFHHISSENLSRDAHESAILKQLAAYKFDYIVLAKYMRILSPAFVAHFKGQIINIHHSFLPAFIGANPYKQAFERGVKIIGATAHFVNDDLDEGPIITQAVLNVSHEDSWADMKKAGQNVEKNVLSKALDLVFEDRIFITNNKTIVF